MKRLILCIILFAALCCLAAGSYLYIAGKTELMLGEVELVSASLESGDYETAHTAAREAERIWADFRKRSCLILNRDALSDITVSLARITSLSVTADLDGDFDDTRKHELITECYVAAALLAQYKQKQEINFYSVL